MGRKVAQQVAGEVTPAGEPSREARLTSVTVFELMGLALRVFSRGLDILQQVQREELDPTNIPPDLLMPASRELLEALARQGR